MAYIIRRYIVVGDAEEAAPTPEPKFQGTGEATLIFHRAPREGIRRPSDVVALLNDEGIETGTLRARNPITHDQWWIPISVMAAAGVPYVKALASVIQTWLKERKGRQVRLENGRTKITANTPEEVERVLAALTRHEKQLGPLQVTKAQKVPPKKIARKKAAIAKRAKKP